MIKAILGLVALCLLSSGAQAQYINPVTGYTSASNPTSTLQMTSATTAYTAGQLIGTSATAGSVVVPSFLLTNIIGTISRVRLYNNDSTSTAWGGQTVQVDLWSAAPTWTNGDRAAWSPATGTATHLATYSCVMSAEYGDGTYAECPLVNSGANGAAAIISQTSTSVFWSLDAVTGSGVTGASKKFTIVPEVLN